MRLGVRRGLELCAMGAGIAAVLGGGCQLLVGLDPVQLAPDGGAGGATTATSSSTTATSSSTTGTGGAPPGCMVDGQRDGKETDVDCGGGQCPACAVGMGCMVGSDCISKECVGGHCNAPSCTDMVQNGNETDIDCGGSCPPCAVGQGCSVGHDCQSAICTASTCTSNLVWARSFGDANPALARGNAVAVDSTGAAIVAGDFQGNADFGTSTLMSAGGTDVFIAKLDATGKTSWAIQYGGAQVNYATAVAVGPQDGIVVAGKYEGSFTTGCGTLPTRNGLFGDVFVTKLGTSGACVWQLSYGGFGQGCAGMAVDAAGNTLATGSFLGTVTFGSSTQLTSMNGVDNAFLLVLDPGGNIVRVTPFYDGVGSEGLAVAVDAQRSVLMAGDFSSSVSFGGPALTSKGGMDAFVAKLDATGAHVWSKGFGSVNNQIATSIAVDPSGNVLVAGSFASLIDFGLGPLISAGADDVFVAKLDPSGNALWNKRFGDAADQTSLLVATDTSGNVYVYGSFPGTIDFGGGPLMGKGELYVAKLDPNGNHLWSWQYGGSQAQLATGITSAGMGKVLLTGEFSGTLDLGGGALPGSGGAFVAELRTP